MSPMKSGARRWSASRAVATGASSLIIVKGMEADVIADDVLVAADELADPELLPALERLRDRGIIDTDVMQHLIDTCSNVRALHEGQ